jgi:membrane fusion protein, multidrug efflux system
MLKNQYQCAHIATILIAAAALLSVSACSKPAPPSEPVRAVKALTVAPSSFKAAHEYAAEVRAQVESKVSFRVGGKLIKRQVEVGQHVKAGQVLAQLDPQDLALGASAARAALNAAKTNRDLAAADYKRFADLRAQNFISEAELERRQTAYKAAQAQFEQARAQMSVQGNQASYATLTAPIAGIVTAVDAEVGQVVSAGAPVLRIAQDGPRDVVFSVPEDKVSAIKVGATTEIRTWATGQTVPNTETPALSGQVHEVAASADPVTRTYPVKVALKSNAGDALPLGSTVYVMPEGLSPKGLEVIKLPTSALMRSAASGNAQSSAVWLIDKTSMTVKSQAVQVATADGNEVVIASGLQPGDVVVTAGVHVLAPGQKVSIYKENPPVAGENIAQAATKNVANQNTAAGAPSASSPK